MSYDNWKTTNREDERLSREPPCEETPKFDDHDVCLWCGADPTQACQWHSKGNLT